MGEQDAVLVGVSRLAAWLAFSRAHVRRMSEVAVQDPRTVDVGADPGYFEPTAQELWRRVQAAPVIGRVGHTRRYAGGPANPDPGRPAPPWVTRQGVDLSVLQQVQLSYRLQAGREYRDESVSPVVRKRRKRATT